MAFDFRFWKSWHSAMRRGVVIGRRCEPGGHFRAQSDGSKKLEADIPAGDADSYNKSPQSPKAEFLTVASSALCKALHKAENRAIMAILLTGSSVSIV